MHGYFIFTEDSAGELSQFTNLFGLALERSGEHYTFSELVDAPEYSIAGDLFLGATTSLTYEGKPFEVMRENGLVYNFNLGLVVPIETVVSPLKITQGANYFVSKGLILPGSIKNDGTRVTDYSARYSFASGRFKYSEVIYV